METHPARSPGTTAGYALAAGIILLDGGLLALLLSEPVTVFTFLWGSLLFLSLPALALIIYWTAALTRARYVVGDGALTISWGPLHHVIPLGEIESVSSGAGGGSVAHFRGLRWPGYQLGKGQMVNHPRISGAVQLFASRPQAQHLLVQTGRGTYALTPADSERFRAALEALLAVGHDRREQAGEGPAPRASSGWISWPIWGDATAQWILFLGLSLNALLFLTLTALYPQLAATLPLRIDAAGSIVRTGPAGRLFLLPLFGLFAWLFNSLLGWFFYGRRDEQVVAYLLWIGAAVVQIAAWVAIVLLLWSGPN